MKSNISLPLILIASIALSVAWSGCVSTPYRRASHDKPPAEPLGLTSQRGAVAVTLESVIRPKGPGSWKENAYWEEYVVSIANASPNPVRISAASLVHDSRRPVSAGRDPWMVEKMSERPETVDVVDVASHPIVTGTVALGGRVMAIRGAWRRNTGEMLGGVLVSATACALPAMLASADANARREIEAEFARRRLEVPSSLPPGEAVVGSLFFPITPAADGLVIHFNARGRPDAVRIDLPAGEESI